jgi:hypothetical protein
VRAGLLFLTHRLASKPYLVFNLTVRLRGERMMHWAHQVELGNSDDQGDGAERGE